MLSITSLGFLFLVSSLNSCLNGCFEVVFIITTSGDIQRQFILTDFFSLHISFFFCWNWDILENITLDFIFSLKVIVSDSQIVQQPAWAKSVNWSHCVMWLLDYLALNFVAVFFLKLALWMWALCPHAAKQSWVMIAWRLSSTTWL